MNQNVSTRESVETAMCALKGFVRRFRVRRELVQNLCFVCLTSLARHPKKSLLVHRLQRVPRDRLVLRVFACAKHRTGECLQAILVSTLVMHLATPFWLCLVVLQTLNKSTPLAWANKIFAHPFSTVFVKTFEAAFKTSPTLMSMPAAIFRSASRVS